MGAQKFVPFRSDGSFSHLSESSSYSLHNKFNVFQDIELIYFSKLSLLLSPQIAFRADFIIRDFNSWNALKCIKMVCRIGRIITTKKHKNKSITIVENDTNPTVITSTDGILILI